MISGLVEQQEKVLLFPSNYVCKEIPDVYRWKGMTTPGLLFEDLPIHNSYDQFPFLKEQCHEDFAVLGQFCAKIIALRL